MADFILRKIVLAHHFTAPPGWVCAEYASARLYHGLVYVLGGQVEYRMRDGSNPVLNPGDCLYIPRGTRYIARSTGPEDFVHMTVNFDMEENGALFPALTKCRLRSNTRFEQLFSSLVRHWIVRHPYYRERCLGILYEMTYLLLRETSSAPLQLLEKLQPARAYLDAHFCENFPLDILPRLCGLSETYFRRLFRSVFSETPVEYRTRLRMAQAGDLLLSGMCSIEKAGELSGYEDPAYFSRIFRKVMGQSPSQFLRSQRTAVPEESPPSPELP